MRSRLLPSAALLLTALLVVAGCSSGHGDQVVAPPLGVTTTPPPSYDPTLEPAAAVMAFVPATDTTLTVTDDTQVRLDLGLTDVTSASSAPARAALDAQESSRSARLGTPLLAPVDSRLRATYGFGEDDVDWEARFTGPGGDGWAIKLRDDVPQAGPTAAVAAGVGLLAGATYYPATRIILKGGTLDPTRSWRADPSLTALVGQVAAATYVQRSCVPFATVFGPGLEAQLAPSSTADLTSLDALPAFSVSLGTSLATVQLGAARADAFDRARLAEHLPATHPDFGLGFGDPVADPEGGRVGYTLTDPHVAAELVLARHLPFAVCPGS